MLADAQPDHDAQVLDGYGEADFHAESVRQYRQLLASKRPDHPFLREDDVGFLRQIGALGRDRLRKTEGVTLGGLMMLGREDAIRDRFPHWHLSYRELPADVAVGPRWLDRIAPDGTWNANVFEFYSRVILKLHQGLEVPFALDANQFRNDDSPATQPSARPWSTPSSTPTMRGAPACACCAIHRSTSSSTPACCSSPPIRYGAVG
jgi:ATP-dependent DNA helicase RecG